MPLTPKVVHVLAVYTRSSLNTCTRVNVLWEC